MQILRHVTDIWAEVVGITHGLHDIIRELEDFVCSFFKIQYVTYLLTPNHEYLEVAKIALYGF